MSPFVIPTYFTAKETVTPAVMRMQGALTRFTSFATVQSTALRTSLEATSTAALGVATSSAMLATAIVLPLALATKAAIDFEKQMANVSTLVDTTKESMKAMGDEVLAIASKTPVAIHDLTESLYQIRSEGFSGAYAMEILGTSAHLAVAGLSTATEATKSMATAIRLFGDEGLTTTQIADIFFKTVATGRTTMEQINESFGSNAAIVHEAGIRFAEFQAATAALTNAGLTASEAQTAIKGSVIALLKPTGEMEQAFHSLGVTTGKDLISRLGGLVPAMNAVGEAARKNGLNVNKEFGRVQGLTAYTLLTGSLKGQYEQDLKRMTNGVDEIAEAYRKQLGTTAAQAQIAKNNIQTLAIRIGELLLPALTKVLQIITPVINAIASFAEHHKILSGIVVGSITVLGGFLAATAAVSFTIYAVTKAVFLWELALKSIAFWEGVVTVATKTYATACFGTASGMRGMIAASYLMETSFVAMLGPIGLVVAAIGLLAAVFSDDYKTIYAQTEGLKNFKDGMLQSVEPINQATLALIEYNKAKEDYNDLLNFRQVREYEYSKGMAAGVWNDIVNAVQHPITSLTNVGVIPGHSGMEPDAPNVNAADVQHQYIQGDTQKNNPAPIVNVSVHVDGKGNLIGINHNGVAMPINVGSTGGAFTRK